MEFRLVEGDLPHQGTMEKFAPLNHQVDRFDLKKRHRDRTGKFLQTQVVNLVGPAPQTDSDSANLPPVVGNFAQHVINVTLHRVWQGNPRPDQKCHHHGHRRQRATGMLSPIELSGNHGISMKSLGPQR